MEKAKYPHCDSKVLHAPGKCVFCDEYPDAQADRVINNIAFTGEDVWPEDGRVQPKAQCPAEAARPLGDINKWGGNRPRTQSDIDEMQEEFKQLQKLMGDL